MGSPSIGYTNFLESAVSVAATSEASGYEKENCYDWLTHDFWKAASAVNHYLTADMGSAMSADYFAIAAHDLGTVAAQIQLQYSNDNFSSDIHNATGLLAPTDDKVIYETFGSISSRYWRIYVQVAAAAPLIGVASFGPRLDLPDGMQVGFTPPNLSFNDEVTNQQSEGGAFFGRSVKRLGAQGVISQPRVDPDWARDYWGPFLEHARLKPWFFSWDEANYPDEACYCWTDRAIDPPSYSHSLYMGIDLRFKGLTA